MNRWEKHLTFIYQTLAVVATVSCRNVFRSKDLPTDGVGTIGFNTPFCTLRLTSISCSGSEIDIREVILKYAVKHECIYCDLSM